jgi:hypothetical protein
VLSRFESAPEGEHRFLREILHLLYTSYPPQRPLLRALMGRFLGLFVGVWKKDMAVAPLLEVGTLLHHASMYGHAHNGRRKPLSLPV